MSVEVPVVFEPYSVRTLVRTTIQKDRPVQWFLKNVITLGGVRRQRIERQREIEQQILTGASHTTDLPGVVYFSSKVSIDPQLGWVESQLTPFAQSIIDSMQEGIGETRSGRELE